MFHHRVIVRTRLWSLARVMCTVAVSATGLALTSPRVAAAERAWIPSSPVRQAHSLDCEAAALQVALAAIGINVSQDAIMANVPTDPSPPLGPSGRPSQWGNPEADFVGDVNGRMLVSGYGVYAPPIAAAARAAGSAATAQEGVAPATLYAAVAAGTPVVVWVPHLLAAPSLGRWNAWDGTSVWYSPQEHAQTLVGFDAGAGSVTLADPWDGQFHTYSMGLFESRFAAFHSMAVFVAPPDGPAASMTSGSNAGQELSWRGADGNLSEARGAGTAWSSDAVIAGAGPMASAPAAATTPDNQKIVFWEGTDSALHEMWRTAGTWHGPVVVPGPTTMASAPSVFATSTSQAVFWEVPGGSLAEVWYQQGHWNGPITVPGVGGMASGPSAILASGAQQAVFWKGSDGSLDEVWWTPADGLWHGPVGAIRAPAMASSPGASLVPNGQQIVFWRAASGSLQECWWTPGAGWSGVADWGFAPVMSTPSVVVDQAGTQSVFWRGPKDNAWVARWSSTWSGPTDLGLGPIR